MYVCYELALTGAITAAASPGSKGEGFIPDGTHWAQVSLITSSAVSVWGTSRLLYSIVYI